ncbi:MAG: glycoside hydrolase family 16 protein [bacterium]|nr:glycoside hydrolase family 16 protein [bacterium]MDD4454313.1 glycoside hydrolase family 16 protein [Candidatus Methanomethylophilaceae archaeon]
MKRIVLILAVISMISGCSGSEGGKNDENILPNDDYQHQDGKNNDDQAQPDKSQFHESFMEDFDNKTSDYFSHGSGGKGAAFTWEMGAVSPSYPGIKILSLKLDPDEAAGAGKGPEVISDKFTYYGSYAARLKVPDPRDLQPNVGAVVGYFTYRMDDVKGLSEIDYEWLIADPEIIYVGTWTGPSGKLKRIGRTINMAKGHIYDTSFREDDGSDRRVLTGEQNQPEMIEAIEGFDASAQFHTYGYDWYPDRIRWWLLHPATNDTIVLWNYRGSDVGIPTAHTRYRMNLWHTNNWPVETNPNSIEKPTIPFELEVDWMSYTPFETD